MALTDDAFVLDLTRLGYCSPGGADILSDFVHSAAHRGVAVAVVGLSGRQTQMWLLTGLPIPTQYPTTADAVTALSRRATGWDRGGSLCPPLLWRSCRNRCITCAWPCCSGPRSSRPKDGSWNAYGAAPTRHSRCSHVSHNAPTASCTRSPATCSPSPLSRLKASRSRFRPATQHLRQRSMTATRTVLIRSIFEPVRRSTRPFEAFPGRHRAHGGRTVAVHDQGHQVPRLPAAFAEGAADGVASGEEFRGTTDRVDDLRA